MEFSAWNSAGGIQQAEFTESTEFNSVHGIFSAWNSAGGIQSMEFSRQNSVHGIQQVEFSAWNI